MSKKGENIYKRKDGRWEARYIKGYATDGKAKYGYCYGKTYRIVKEKVNTARAEVLTAPSNREGKLRCRFSVYCDEWLKLKRSRVKTSTYAKYVTVTENHIKPKLGNCFVSSITTMAVEEFAYGLLHSEGLSPKTVKDVLAVLHSVLKYTERQLPFLQPVEVVYPKEEKKETRVLTREEQERFTEYLLHDTDIGKFGTLFALLTGLRIGEVCALKWKDISVTENFVKVTGTVQRIKNTENDGSRKTKIIVSDPKSFSSVRTIPLSPFAVKLCKKYYGQPDAYILTGETDRCAEPRTMQYKMEKYAEDCNLKGVHFHTLRHSFATRCVEVGFEIKSLSEVLGHAGPQITLERYVHSSMELKRENMRKLEILGY